MPDKTIALFPAFDDVEDDDDEMTYTVTGNTNTGLFSVNPPAINGQTGILTLKFKANTSGESTLTIRATDTGGKYIEASFKVTVVPTSDKPVVSNFTRNTDEDTELLCKK
ncbi:MAG: cadherin repeat domain-containing protein [Chloroflexota bacterium]